MLARQSAQPKFSPRYRLTTAGMKHVDSPVVCELSSTDIPRSFDKKRSVRSNLERRVPCLSVCLSAVSLRFRSNRHRTRGRPGLLLLPPTVLFRYNPLSPHLPSSSIHIDYVFFYPPRQGRQNASCDIAVNRLLAPNHQSSGSKSPRLQVYSRVAGARNCFSSALAPP